MKQSKAISMIDTKLNNEFLGKMSSKLETICNNVDKTLKI